MNGTLYLIPTALGDTAWDRYLAPSSRDIACQIEHFVVENAKSARAELKRIGHPKPLRDLIIVELSKCLDATLIEELLSPLGAGHDIGLMSEAGCPAVADPGAILVRRAHANGLRVRPLVGPSSLLLALMASGLNGQRFAFHGYLPQRDVDRRNAIVELEAESKRLNQTQLFIETPYRNNSMFSALLNHCKPETSLSLAIDLTLPSETIMTQSIRRWRSTAPPDLDRRPAVFLILSGN